MANTFEQWYAEIPIVTRTFLTLSTITALAVTFDLLSPLSLYLNYGLVFGEGQVWRLGTSFLFFDRISVNFVFHVYFLYFYCRRLEEHSFHGRGADFLYMMLLGATSMLCIAPFINLPFLSHSLVIMVLYVWSRRNPHEQLQLYGLFTVRAAYLAYVLVALGLMMGQHPLVDVLGITVGHAYYYVADVMPVAYGVEGLVKAPRLLRVIMGEDRAGGLMDDMEDIEQEEQEEDTVLRDGRDGGRGMVAGVAAAAAAAAGGDL